MKIFLHCCSFSSSSSGVALTKFVGVEMFTSRGSCNSGGFPEFGDA
jgi:hypothetical protein